MEIIEQRYEILSKPNKDMIKDIERIARTCYKSEDKITNNSAEKFVKMLVDRGHHAMIEMGHITVKFITNRGVTHELVRHRLCSFAQESTRYVRYKNVQFIKPVWWDDMPGESQYIWIEACKNSEVKYRVLIAQGQRPEQARDVLNNALKTEIVVSANLREWRHIFQLRTSPKAHPQIRELMLPLLNELQELVPVIFDGI